MPSLLDLPLRALDLATRPARFALGVARGLLPGGGHEADDTRVTPAGPPPAPAAPAPTQSSAASAATATAVKPKARPRAKPSPKAARRAARHEPTRGEAAAIRQEQRMEEQDAGGPGPGPTIVVSPPWDDYDGLTEDQILERLVGADPTLRAAVRLYEATHGDRRQILIATE